MICDVIPAIFKDVWSGLVGATIALIIDYYLIKRSQKNERLKVIEAVINSLKDSFGKAWQMLTNELRGGVYPSYPLDTTWLAGVVSDGRRNYPSETIERINGLRFQMEHLNKKMLIKQISSPTPEQKVYVDAANLAESWATQGKSNELLSAYEKTLGQNQSEDRNIAWLLLGCLEQTNKLVQEMTNLKKDEIHKVF